VTWAKMILALAQLLPQLVLWAERRQLISDAQKAQAFDLLRGMLDDERKAEDARAAARRRMREPGGLRDDDGFRRPE
jgi:hypothetical protein